MKKIGSLSVRSDELKTQDKREGTQVPSLSDDARETIQKLRTIRERTAARAHMIRLG